MTLRNRSFLLFAALVVSACTTMGCELLVDFDRSLIDGGVEDATAPDGGFPDSETPVDAPADSPADTTIPPSDTGAPDASPDTGGGEDTGTDAGEDAGEDAGVDAGSDSGPDAGVDSGVDSGTPVDAGTDAGVDAGIDAGFDAGFDAGIDAGTDAGVDAGTDAGPAPQVSTFTDDEEDAGCAGVSPSGVTLTWATMNATGISITYDFTDAGTPLTSGPLGASGTAVDVSTIFSTLPTIECGDSVTLTATGAGTATRTVTF